ncbi:MAG: lysophospholipid acyltransferase family protein [Alistipes sp.]|nr:lysophospholipid acyltransferase family protein [Alistipes sp.]
MCRTLCSVVYYLLLLVFTSIYYVLFVLLFVLTVGFDRERVALHWASKVWAVGIYRLCPFWRVELVDAQKIDRTRPQVIITNHQSMLDIPLMYVLPTTFKWVSKKEVRRMPLFGSVLGMHGDILVDRGSRSSAKEMTRQCVERLGRGTSVMIFPEGTRTKTGHIGRFKDGAFFVAKHAQVGIQPVVADGNWGLSCGWRLQMPYTIRVKVLDPVSPEEVASKEAHTLATELEERMRTEHEKMRAELGRP